MLLSKPWSVSPLAFFLGLGLGTGYMTSLRFLGPIGPSEIFFLVSYLILFVKFGRSLARFNYDFSGLIKLYFLFFVLVIFPLMTSVTALVLGEKVFPEYIASFILGVSLSFLLVEALKNKYIHMNAVVFWFAISFIISNLFTIYLFGVTSAQERYSGAASNPNQLMFYASCLSMLLVIYSRRLSLIFLPIVVWIALKSESDAYILTLFVTLFLYIVLLVFFGKKLSFSTSIFLIIILMCFGLYFLFLRFSDIVLSIWNAADEGGVRINLFINAVYATLESPFFGFGAGNFSGIESPFSGLEAHNTFLDFSMQFGILFPVLIYYVFFVFLIDRVRQGFYLQAAFVAAFIVSGFFHFTGRHFYFWVEFAIFYFYVFYSKRANS